VLTLLLQNAPRFGYESATMKIENPAMFVKGENGYYRFVIEDFDVEVVNGMVMIDDFDIEKILKGALTYML